MSADSLKQKGAVSISVRCFSPHSENGKLRYFEHSGAGFSEKELKDAIVRLKPLITNQAPVENLPEIPEKIRWVRPELVCELAFAKWTLDGELRQTTFLGWRDDKDPKEVVLRISRGELMMPKLAFQRSQRAGNGARLFPGGTDSFL